MGRKKTPVTVPDDEDMEKFTIPSGDKEGAEDEEDEGEDASSTGTVISAEQARLQKYDEDTRRGNDQFIEEIDKLAAITEEKKSDYKIAKEALEKAQLEFNNWIRTRKAERHQPRLF